MGNYRHAEYKKRRNDQTRTVATRSNARWTGEEERFVQANWRMTNVDVGLALGRSESAVQVRRHKMGLLKNVQRASLS